MADPKAASRRRLLAWQKTQVPAGVVLDSTAEWTPFWTAALWASNGGRGGDVDPAGPETGANEILGRAADGTLEIQGLLNKPGKGKHGYLVTLPAARFKRAVFVWLEADDKSRPRVAFDLEPPAKKSDNDRADFRLDFFLPEERQPRWRTLEVRTDHLLKAFDQDAWVQPYQADGGPGRGSSKELLLAKLRRRHAAGQMLLDRPEEFRWLSTWISNPDGRPHALGWPPAKERSLENFLGDEHARLRLDAKNG